MSAVRFRTQLRSDSAHVPQTCVSGREGKGREEEGITTSFLVTFRNARLSTGRASAPDVPGETPTRMMPGGAR